MLRIKNRRRSGGGPHCLVANPIKLYLSLILFLFFVVKIGHFILNDFSLCNIHASLTAKICKRRKKFVGFARLQTYFNHLKSKLIAIWRILF
jgi:hypothetical protein